MVRTGVKRKYLPTKKRLTMFDYEIEIKRKYARNLIEDLVSDYLYYDRKEDEDLTRQELAEIMTVEFAEELAERFLEELLNHVKS